MTWHWIITLGWADPRGQANSTTSGTLTPEQGGTRDGAYNAVLDAARRANNIPASTPAPVLFFSLEPDTLAFSVPEPAHAAGGA